jgi:hypothetical protein
MLNLNPWQQIQGLGGIYGVMKLYIFLRDALSRGRERRERSRYLHFRHAKVEGVGWIPLNDLGNNAVQFLELSDSLAGLQRKRRKLSELKIALRVSLEPKFDLGADLKDCTLLRGCFRGCKAF